MPVANRKSRQLLIDTQTSMFSSVATRLVAEENGETRNSNNDNNNNDDNDNRFSYY